MRNIICFSCYLRTTEKHINANNVLSLNKKICLICRIMSINLSFLLLGLVTNAISAMNVDLE